MEQQDPSSIPPRKASRSWYVTLLRLPWLIITFGGRLLFRQPLIALCITGAVIVSFFYFSKGGVHVQLTHTSTIDVTPEEIRQIKQIGQWEFLAIDTEELVDTTRKGFFSDSQLARIYRGTLRLGIDLEQASPDWFTAAGDTARLRLPDIVLLDKQFVDEARTRSFYESGKWTDADREALYQRARKAMLKRCFTAANRHEARENARHQFTSLFRNFGFQTVEIVFTPSSTHPPKNS